MTIDFACKCGKALRAQEDHAGKRVQCPQCGRVLLIPAPAVTSPVSRWEVHEGPGIVKKAEALGIIGEGQAHVVSLRGSAPLAGNLQVNGNLTCWYCRTGTPFEGEIFGRIGVAGELVALACAECTARLWTGFSNYQGDGGTDVYLYAPSHTRQQGDTRPISTFRVENVVELPPAAPSRELGEWLDNALSGVVQAVSKRESYQAISARAAPLVSQLLPPEMLKLACRTLRALLEKETMTHSRAILVEALAALRDASAARAVRAAADRSLAQDDPADATNLPLQDLCILATLFGQEDILLGAVTRGMDRHHTLTRAIKLDKRLTADEVGRVVHRRQTIDAYESVLGRDRWQRILPLVSAPPEPPEQGWLKKLFNRA
jgi:hypothetical protein